jgi:chromate transporter
MRIHLALNDWLDLFRHFLSLSLLAVGGGLTAAPDMHRYLVLERHWLTAAQFTASIALAQAAPGPNVLFIALMGWNVGLNAAAGAALPGWIAWSLGLLGACLTLSGMLLPSSILIWAATRWARNNRDLRAVRAFKTGLAPCVVALLLVTGWLLAQAAAGSAMPGRDWRLWLLTAATAGLVWKTRLHLLWLIGAGALLGMLGVV